MIKPFISFNPHYDPRGICDCHDFAGLIPVPGSSTFSMAMEILLGDRVQEGV